MWKQPLRVYGHQTVQMENDCYDSKLEVPFRNQNAVRLRIPSTTFARRSDPIAYSLEQSIKDFGEPKPNQRNVIVLITDGAESCGPILRGIPAAAGKGRSDEIL